jgi:hypothetical protein
VRNCTSKFGGQPRQQRNHSSARMLSRMGNETDITLYPGAPANTNPLPRFAPADSTRVLLSAVRVFPVVYGAPKTHETCVDPKYETFLMVETAQLRVR